MINAPFAAKPSPIAIAATMAREISGPILPPTTFLSRPQFDVSQSALI